MVKTTNQNKDGMGLELEDIKTSSHEYAESVRPMQIQ
jgi:hypothetical protein